MKKVLALLLSMAMLLSISAAALAESDDYDYTALYKAIRDAHIHQAAYELDPMYDLIELFFNSFDKVGTVNQALAAIADPDDETLAKLEALREAYESLTKIREYDEVCFDIWEGYDAPPLPGTEKDTWETELGFLADDPGHRPFLNDFRLADPASAKGTLLVVDSVRGSNNENMDYIKTFNAFGYNVMTLEGRFDLLEEGGRYALLALDSQRAIRYLKAHGDELGIDPDRIFAVGGSKGNIVHKVAYEYFDMSPVETSAALGLTLEGYTPDDIDAIPADIRVSIFSYGSSQLLNSTMDDVAILESRIYSPENYAAGHVFQDVFLICGNLDGDANRFPTVIKGLMDYNSSDDKLYRVNFETHIINNVGHGVGAGLIFDNYSKIWPEAEAFISACLDEAK
jgi:hypothetical protein